LLQRIATIRCIKQQIPEDDLLTRDLPIRLNGNQRLPHPATLIEQAAWLVREHGDDTALVMIVNDGEQSITYREFFAAAACYGEALAAAGIQPCNLVALILQHGEAVMYGFWGAILMGAVPSIFPFLSDKLDPDRYFDSVRQLVDHEGVRAVITYTELEPALGKHLAGVDVVIINSETYKPHLRDPPARSPSPNWRGGWGVRSHPSPPLSSSTLPAAPGCKRASCFRTVPC
jgi:acyl-CoA synthetase (AMP-forming)/AMP-acid ligase II